MYAIVDIETTGGFAGKSKITEVAIYVHDGEKVIDRYETLINPEQTIPSYITGLTGIDQSLVDSAPTFKEVASEIYEMLNDKVFVAHNVHFDYSFIKKSLEEDGYQFTPKKLCTVRLSRNIFPGMRSYSLGKLCEQLKINIKNRHRAGGDAEATAVLFDMLIKENPEFIKLALKRGSKETTLPPNLPKEEFDNLPEMPGVYYFINANSEVIYVGKAIDIKKRITSHFSGTSKHRRNQYIRNEIHHIDYELTGNELVALLLESQEIKRIWPKYNKALKFIGNPWAVYDYEDRSGYLRFNICKRVKGVEPLITFNSHSDAWQFMIEKAKEFDLCMKLSGIQKSNGACYNLAIDKCRGACTGMETTTKYNKRITKAIASFYNEERSFVIRGAGRTEDEHSIILVENGSYHGYGFCDTGFAPTGIEDVKQVVQGYQSTREIEQYIQSFINSSTSEVIELN